MEALRDEARTSTLFAKINAVARSRYGIRVQDAEDIFHDAVLTYLLVHERYPPNDNHFGILVGIFHKKSLEYLGRQERTDRVSRRFVGRLRADQPAVARGEDPGGAAVERVIRREDAELILAALSTLNLEGREMLLCLAEGKTSRLEMIEELGINRNTFDTRLRSLRLRLKKVLVDTGVI